MGSQLVKEAVVHLDNGGKIIFEMSNKLNSF